MLTKTVLEKIEKMEDCPLYNKYIDLKEFSEEGRAIAEQNKLMIKTNHEETLAMIEKMNKTIERTGRIFAWWDSLHASIRVPAKIISIVVGVMGGVIIIITFFEKLGF